MGINRSLFTSQSGCWETPKWLFDELDQEFHFTLDPASTPSNAKCRKHFTEAEDGLSRTWEGESVFCNPPYGRGIAEWAEKCLAESGHARVVLLAPARTDTEWFHRFVLGHAELRFVQGRLYFGIGGKEAGRAPFPSLVAVYPCGGGQDAGLTPWPPKAYTAVGRR